MRLVVDSNIVIAGLLRDGLTRGLLIEAHVDLASPEWMLAEIARHRDAVAARAGLSGEEFDLLFALLTERIEIVPASSYAACLKEATALIGARDAGDVPFLALALAHDCDGIWTQNPRHFADAGVEVWGTSEVAAWVKSGSDV